MRMVAALLASAAGVCSGFQVTTAGLSLHTARSSALRPMMQESEELEFIIHTDGRVEERVRGVKGASCQEVTAEINKALGEVYEVKPTQEMFEQEIRVNVEQDATVSESWGTSSWGSDSGEGGGDSQW